MRVTIWVSAMTPDTIHSLIEIHGKLSREGLMQKLSIPVSSLDLILRKLIEARRIDFKTVKNGRHKRRIYFARKSHDRLE